MTDGLILRQINLDLFEDKQVLNEFLSRFDIKLDDDVEESIGLFAQDKLVATCSLSGKVLKGFAVENEYQGSNLTSTLITEMVKRLFERGIYKSFIFTRPKNKTIFASLGYRYIAQGNNIVLLENGLDGIDKYIEYLRQARKSNGVNGCIVMNANPFTWGHHYLVSRASKLCDQLYIIVVEENRSDFPFTVRKKLVEEGTQDIHNVIVLSGSDYVISSATFPGYFIKKPGERITSEATLDLDIFTRYIAPALNIHKRFVGNEPYDQVTATYNQVMAQILPHNNIEFIEIPRYEMDGKAISASRVRKYIKLGQIGEIVNLVPPTTFKYINSVAGREIIERIKNKTD